MSRDLALADAARSASESLQDQYMQGGDAADLAENMAEGFWTPKDPLSQEEQDRLEHLRQELHDLQEPSEA